jgi:nitric oxide reductase subunit C
MLSKSQARAFFLGGTALFAATFLFLSFDTVRQTGARTNAANLTDSVRRGKELWDRNNCMGCHTLLGEGAYYAPDLTKVYDRRGPEWMRVFIRDPQAMFPGERKMVQYDFTEQEIDDVIAFLKWCGEIDTNGWPPAPAIAGPSAGSTASAAGAASGATVPQPEKFAQLCVACHSVGGKGGVVGPALDGIGARRDAAYLHKWIADPQAIKPGTAMPKLPLSAAELDQITNYLSGLK